MKKLMKNKRGFIQIMGAGGIILAVFIIILFLVPTAGIVKFMISDKTPYILGGLFIVIILFGRKKRMERAGNYG